MKPPLLSFVLILSVLSFGTAAGQHAWRHRPPWRAPVASSQMIRVGGAQIQIDFAPGNLDLAQPKVVRWVETAAKAVSLYYGGFPVARARVLIQPVAGERGVLTGNTWGGVDGFPVFTRMRLGQHTTEADLTDDWTMTHEFIHSAFPDLAPNHHWLEEGLATYVEPIARAQLGTESTQTIWGQMLRGMPQGQPGLAGAGLDNTHTWASTYWSGALFCLVADVSIRERTGNRKGLQDTLRAIVSSGGTIDHSWPIARALTVGDRATGTSVLVNLYSKMGKGPDPLNLDALWKRLGVSYGVGGVAFDKQAPLARIRESITAPGLPVRRTGLQGRLNLPGS